MIASRLDLPDIWRGCDWPAITLNWRDSFGNPYDLTDYQPLAKATNFDLHAAVIGDPTQGVTQIAIPKVETGVFALGVNRWDWVWKHVPTQFIFPRFFLFGEVTVREPISEFPVTKAPP